MTEPYTTAVSGNLLMEVFYEESHWRVRVTDTETKKSKEDSVRCTFTPSFGIDVADMSMINEAAEKMAVEMENEANGRDIND